MKDQSVSRFWEKFIVKTKDYGVKPNAVRWYVRDAELYIKAYVDTKLANHEAHFVEQYLERKSRNTRLEEWQFVQVITAIKILFTKMVQVSWAEKFPWEQWVEQSKGLSKSSSNTSQQLSDKETAYLKESLEKKSHDSSGLFNQFFSIYPNHVENIIKCIRVNHYSKRTEQTYLGWFMRFVAFHRFKDPLELTDNDIVTYLEHLFMKRKV